MNMPWISLLGLMQQDQTILDNMVLPTAADYADIEDIIVDDPFVPNKTDFINFLLIETAELPLVYPDPAAMKTMVGYWSKAKLPEWVAIYKTLLYKYNPLWNKDGKITERRDIEYSKSGSTTDTGTVATENDTTSTGTVVTDNDTTSTGTVSRSGSSSGSAEHQVTGYDTNSYSPDTKDITSGSASETTTNNLAGTDDTTVTNNLAGSSDTTVTNDLAGTMEEGGTTTDVFERVEQGNIGLTTTMALIKEQRELAAFNFYDYLMQAFKKQFCVMIW